MSNPLPDAALDQLFRLARTYRTWTDEPVTETTLRAIADLMKMGPTANNGCPARLVFVVSREAKQKLEPCLAEGNKAKTMAAPATVIVGADRKFFEKLPQLAPHASYPPGYVDKPDVVDRIALRNSSLQGAYLIMAARALGLDCGPMSGFSGPRVDEAFFAGTAIKSNFLCNIGYGEPAGLHPRGPRLAFDEFCRIA